MINDGFGDGPQYARLTRQEILDSVLPDRLRWLRVVASQMGSVNDRDDLVQEGLIAMWRALDSYDPATGVPLPQWLQHKARYRMLDVRNGKALTGAPKPDADAPKTDARGAAAREKIKAVLRANPNATGRQIAAETSMSTATVSYHRQRLGYDREPLTYTSLEALLDEGFDPTGAGEVLDSVIAAYAEGEILRALNVLTPAERKYVVLRFWRGATPSELRAAFGYEPTGVWVSAKRRLKPVLAHLLA